MSERIHTAAEHVATHGLRNDLSHVLGELTADVRIQLEGLGGTESLLNYIDQNLGVDDVAVAVATLAIDGADAEADPIELVIPFEARGPYRVQIRELLQGLAAA